MAQPHEKLGNRVLAAIAGKLSSLPAPVLKLFGTEENSSGYKLDGDVVASLRVLSALPGEDFTKLPVAKGRELIDTEAFLAAGPTIQIGAVTDGQIAGVKVRSYRPAGVLVAAELPTVIYLHGGGWVLGSLYSHDNVCRYLVQQTGVQVIAVDYRLAPEAPFPAGLDDVTAVFNELVSNGAAYGADANKILVGGDSAGGNLSAALCLRQKRENAQQPLAQLLFVPVTDLGAMDTGSYKEFASGYFLTHEQMVWYREHYCGGVAAAQENPEISPLRATDHAALAPAYVAVAGFDPLRDEGIAYAEKLRAAGVPVELRVHEGMVHPFVNSVGIWEGARAALDDASTYILQRIG